MGERAQKNIGDTLARFGERWEGEWLPEIQQHIARCDSFDLPGASLASLMAHLDETVVGLRRLYHIHFQIVIPVLLLIRRTFLV